MSKKATCFGITAPTGHQFYMKKYEKYNLRFSLTIAKDSILLGYENVTGCNSNVSENCSAFIFRVHSYVSLIRAQNAYAHFHHCFECLHNHVYTL